MKKVLGVVLVAAGAVLTTSASAYDWKVMAGAACLPTSPSSAPSYVKSSLGVLSSTATFGTATFVCPVIRDSVRGTSGLADIHVTVTDTGGGQAACNATSADGSTGNLVATSLGATSGTTFSGGAKLLNLSVSGSVDYGFYNINCNLDPSTGIITYGWAEFDEM